MFQKSFFNLALVTMFVAMACTNLSPAFGQKQIGFDDSAKSKDEPAKPAATPSAPGQPAEPPEPAVQQQLKDIQTQLGDIKSLLNKLISDRKSIDQSKQPAPTQTGWLEMLGYVALGILIAQIIIWGFKKLAARGGHGGGEAASAVILAVLLAASAVNSQAANPPGPELKSFVPGYVTQGYKGNLSLCGSNLDATQVLEFPKGVEVTNKDGKGTKAGNCVRFTVEVASDAEPGSYSFRFGGKVFQTPALAVVDVNLMTASRREFAAKAEVAKLQQRTSWLTAATETSTALIKQVEKDAAAAAADLRKKLDQQPQGLSEQNIMEIARSAAQKEVSALATRMERGFKQNHDAIQAAQNTADSANALAQTTANLQVAELSVWAKGKKVSKPEAQQALFKLRCAIARNRGQQMAEGCTKALAQ